MTAIARTCLLTLSFGQDEGRNSMSEFETAESIDKNFRIGDGISVKMHWYQVWVDGYYGGRDPDDPDWVHIYWLSPDSDRTVVMHPADFPVRRLEKNEISSVEMIFASGETIMALHSDNLWHPAEIRKPVDNGYMVDWLDGSRGNRIPKAGIQPFPPLLEHRYAIGDRIIVEDDGCWCTGSIAGLTNVGYFVDWENGEDRSRIVDGQTHAVPAKHVTLRIDQRCLVQADPDWYPAVVRSVYEGRYEIVWESGGPKENVESEYVLPFPEKKHADTATDASDKATSSLMSSLQTYLEQRAASGDLAPDHSEAGYCPNCEATHAVNWFRDKPNATWFFVCANRQPQIILKGAAGLEAMTIPAFLTRYPAGPRLRGLGALFSRSEVEISAGPPFVSLKFGKR